MLEVLDDDFHVREHDRAVELRVTSGDRNLDRVFAARGLLSTQRVDEPRRVRRRAKL